MSVRRCMLWGCGLAVLSLSACGDTDPNMRRQPRMKPFRASGFFENGSSARPLPPGVVPRDEPRGASEPRSELTLEVLQRGQQRFNIFCSMCHGRDGYGLGMVARRGFPQPPSFHAADIRGKTDEHYFRVITEGLGKMPPYGRVVPDRDRWAMVEYIRALQLSQHARTLDAPTEKLLPAGDETTPRTPVAMPDGGMGGAS